MKRWMMGVALAAIAPTQIQAQEVAFRSELPRVMVFLKEDGATAATAVTRFLQEAGFEVVDPAFAKNAAQRDRAARALAGDDAEATALGRDLGAQVIVLGTAPATAAPSPADAALQLGTAEINVRALRLDQPRVIATGSASGRAVDGTALAATSGALRKATESLLYASGFLGKVANDWTRRPWSDRDYWQPEPASVPAQLAAATAPAPGRPAGRAPLIALVDANVYPDSGARGITVSAAKSNPMRARIRGIVLDPSATVNVGGRPARTRALTAEDRKRYGATGAGLFFEADARVGPGQDTLRVVASGAGGAREILARPRIGKRWAVIIGVSAYADPRITPLAYADDDARAMYAFLRSPAGGSVPEEQMKLLVDRDATTAAIRDALFVFLQQADENDFVTVYIASHGAPDPGRPENLYILPYDSDPDRIASTSFPMWDFKTALRRQIRSSRVVVIADACHSGGVHSGETNPLGAAFDDLFDPSMRVTLSAAASDELSREGPQWGGGHGVFTYTLLQGLGGAADSDRNGVVTFAEASEYVRSKVAAETGGEQNPTRAGLGDVPVALLGAGGAK